MPEQTCMQHNKHMSKELAVSIQKWLLATESVRVSFQRLAARNIPHEELVAAIEKVLCPVSCHTYRGTQLPVVGLARTYPADTPMLLFQLDGYLVRPFQVNCCELLCLTTALGSSHMPFQVPRLTFPSPRACKLSFRRGLTCCSHSKLFICMTSLAVQYGQTA